MCIWYPFCGLDGWVVLTCYALNLFILGSSDFPNAKGIIQAKMEEVKCHEQTVFCQ